MSNTAQDYQKLLTEAIHKQMSILGSQITLVKAQHVPGLTITDEGTVTAIAQNPQTVVMQFLSQFRDLSSPLVKKTMQPLLSTLTTIQTTNTTQQDTLSNPKELVPKT